MDSLYNLFLIKSASMVELSEDEKIKLLCDAVEEYIRQMVQNTTR